MHFVRSTQKNAPQRVRLLRGADDSTVNLFLTEWVIQSP